MLIALFKELFAGTTVLDVVVALTAVGFWIFRLGEWKRGLRERRSARIELQKEPSGPVVAPVSEERVRLIVVDEARKAKHESISASNAAIGKLADRFDRAGEKMSTLATHVQGLPTQNDVAEIKRELGRLREGQENLRDLVAENGERIARIEGR